MNQQSEHITGLILAGGQGHRFGNRDKGLIEWQGKALVEHALDFLRPQTDNIIISCNRNFSVYQQYGYPCVEDIMSDYQGPLAGVQTGLKNCPTELCLVIPCDSPKLPADLLSRLLKALRNNNADLAYAFDGERQHFLTALIKTTVEPSLNSYLKQEDRRVRGWFKHISVTEVDFSDQNKAFLNLNSPEALA